MRRSVCLLAFSLMAAAAPALPPEILTADYPRVFFFRAAESAAAKPDTSYEKWDQTFSQLEGIMGKALNEELGGREERNPEFFTRFKTAHPEQLVMLHFNGNARDPIYDCEKFFAGHWVYNGAAQIQSDVPAESGETEIKVSSTKLFKTGTGRYKKSNSDIGLFMTKDGKHDWENGEQVQLISVDEAKGTIRVRRGCYGTVPHAFPAKKSRAAAHMDEGPWGKKSHLLWVYNFSTECPRDRQGRTCSDALVEDLKSKFLPDGKLAAFDGLEFDVSKNSNRGDMDGDGKAEHGIFNGVNTYGAGVIEFYSKLRAALGKDRLIMADGGVVSSQRGFGILNGIESEGWPGLSDWNLADWSGGMNRHMFWNSTGYPPAFSYVNHKYTAPGELPGDRSVPAIPFSTHRLVFAASQFFDAAVCCTFLPEPEPGEQIGTWDELKMGRENRIGWLGKPEGSAVHLAALTPDLLKNENPPQFSQNENQGMSASLTVPCKGSDLLLTVKASGRPLTRYPESYARLMTVGIKGDEKQRLMTWVGGKEFESTFYFKNIQSDRVELTFEIEGTEPAVISSMTAHASPDTMYRVFTKGLVLANPSAQPFTFDLQKLTPGRTYRRLQGSSKQDTQANNGMPVEDKITLGPLDALFLVRVSPAP